MPASRPAIAAFDADRFERDIVPALRRGDSDPLVAHYVSLLADEPYTTTGSRGLARWFADCSADLQDGPAWSCSCLEAGRAPTPNDTDWKYDGVCSLVEAVIVNECLGAGAVLGRRYSPMELEYAVVELDATTLSIIEHFNRSCPWTHGSGGYREGIRSWVDSTGAELFELGLCNLTVNDELGDQESNAAWLSLVHRVATAAVEAGMGLLWGVDLACVYARAGSALYPAGPSTFSL